MEYKSGDIFPYIPNSDWYMTPTGEVGFFRDDIPEEIKARLIEDAKRMYEEELTKGADSF